MVGLGPGSLGRLPASTRALLLDPATTVIVRTLQHPAAAELAAQRVVQSCDDLYQHATFEQVYDAIADRVVAAAEKGPTIYAVPGSALVGELAVGRILRRPPGRNAAGGVVYRCGAGRSRIRPAGPRTSSSQWPPAALPPRHRRSDRGRTARPSLGDGRRLLAAFEGGRRRGRRRPS